MPFYKLILTEEVTLFLAPSIENGIPFTHLEHAMQTQSALVIFVGITGSEFKVLCQTAEKSGGISG